MPQPVQPKRGRLAFTRSFYIKHQAAVVDRGTTGQATNGTCSRYLQHMWYSTNFCYLVIFLYKLHKIPLPQQHYLKNAAVSNHLRYCLGARDLNTCTFVQLDFKITFPNASQVLDCDKNIVFLCLGNISKWKGQPEAIATLSRLLRASLPGSPVPLPTTTSS